MICVGLPAEPADGTRDADVAYTLPGPPDLIHTSREVAASNDITLELIIVKNAPPTLPTPTVAEAPGFYPA